METKPEIDRTIFITGGHLMPALAVLEELEKSGNWKIFYIGRKTSLEGNRTVSAEYKLLSSRLGNNFLPIITGRLQRSFTKHTIPSLLKLPIGFFQCLFWCAKLKPSIILSFGGYVAVPVVIAAWLQGIPVATHEQTLITGLANRLINPFAKRIFVSWRQSPGNAESGNVVYTGNPIPKHFFEQNKTDLFEKYRSIKNSGKYKLTIYITGGSQGSKSINDVVLAILPDLLKKYIVIHQYGQSTSSPEINFDNYFSHPYTSPLEIGWVFENADIVIGRSGANTVTNIAAMGKVAILIPLPWSGGNEQVKNAQLLENCGTAVVLLQTTLTPKSLLGAISTIEKNFSKYKSKTNEAKKLIGLNAAKAIVTEIEKIVDKTK